MRNSDGKRVKTVTQLHCASRENAGDVSVMNKVIMATPHHGDVESDVEHRFQLLFNKRIILAIIRK